MKDIAVIIPSIRPKNLVKVYDSLVSACTRYSFELIIPSPYLIPEELMTRGNVKYFHTYTNPTIAFQMAALLADSKYIYNTTDDGLVQPNAIDSALDILTNQAQIDLINMIYNEDYLDAETLEIRKDLEPYKLSQQYLINFHNIYWKPYSHNELKLPGINPEWKLCPHFIVDTEYFIELGGFDCDYEYSNHALHDFTFRAQSNGSIIHLTPYVAFLCSWYPGDTGDHGPVVEAQLGPDLKRFTEIYSQPNAAANRVKIRYDDWKDKDPIWTRRFDPQDLKVRI